jgi:hypothetical protein
MNDFYLGYASAPPASLARWLRRVIVALLAIVAGVAIALATAQAPFAKSYFEYGKPRTFRGAVQLTPGPLLLVDDETNSSAAYLLVAPGKHGAEPLLRAFDGQTVELQGELISREGNAMIQVQPDSITRVESLRVSAVTEDLGVQRVTGEIVDTKCFLGVMNPGSGKVHRDCAARCLSGGIPPALVSNGKVYVLAGAAEPERQRLRLQAGEVVTIEGPVSRRAGVLFLHGTLPH